MSEDKKNNDFSDIQELTDAFLDLMDTSMKEEEEAKAKAGVVKDLIADFVKPISDYEEKIQCDNSELDEVALAEKFEKGGFADSNSQSTDEVMLEELSEHREKRIFIASLHLAGKPIEMTTFRKILQPINLENRLLTYAEEFNDLKIGLRIRMVNGGYQLVTDSDVTEYLQRFFGEKTETLSRAALETSAIIAYRQPITKAEVDEMREVNSSGTMRYLLDKNLIKVTGRKQVAGKPLLYSTTKYFLEYFGLNELSELPTFREWQELKNN